MPALKPATIGQKFLTDCGQNRPLTTIVNKCTVKFIFADNKYGEFDVEMQQKMTLNNIALTTGDVMTSEDFMSRIK